VICVADGTVVPFGEAIVGGVGGVGGVIPGPEQITSTARFLAVPGQGSPKFPLLALTTQTFCPMQLDWTTLMVLLALHEPAVKEPQDPVGTDP